MEINAHMIINYYINLNLDIMYSNIKALILCLRDRSLVNIINYLQIELELEKKTSGFKGQLSKKRVMHDLRSVKLDHHLSCHLKSLGWLDETRTYSCLTPKS